MAQLNNSIIQPYEPPESLWELIKQYVNESELEDVKSVIGESLIDQIVDLHNEIDSLLDIWRDYRHETLDGLDRISRTNSSKLPEPPEARERLVIEIEFFIKQMREKFDDRTFSRQLVTNNHNLEVISYVLNEKKNTPAPGAYSVAGGTPSFMNSSTLSLNSTSTATTPRPHSAMSSKSGLETPCKLYSNKNELQMRTMLECSVDESKLNCYNIDEIVDHIREQLQSEIEILLKDIDFLYECIDRESEYRTQSKINTKQPTLNELKEERKRLEENMLPVSTNANLRMQRTPSVSSITSINLTLKTPSPQPTLAPLDHKQFRTHKHGVATTTTTTKPSAITSKHVPITPLYNNYVYPPASAASTASNQMPKIELKKYTATNRHNLSSENLLNLTSDSASSILSATSQASYVSHMSKQQKTVEKFRQMVLHSRDST